MDISKLLTFSAKEGASDCHISAGEPPMIRIHGDLKKLDHPPLTQEETHALVYDMMSDAQRKTFEEKRECDFSFELGDEIVVALPPDLKGLPEHPHRNQSVGKTQYAAHPPPALRQGKRLDPRNRANRIR